VRGVVGGRCPFLCRNPTQICWPRKNLPVTRYKVVYIGSVIRHHLNKTGDRNVKRKESN